jgi:methylmalonyl-CoA mutase N-terminal domain/subunit
VNPDRELAAAAHVEGWKVMRVKRLDRRRTAGVAMAGAAAAAGIGGTALASGYHIREIGSTAAREFAFTLKGLSHVRRARARASTLTSTRSRRG